MKHALSAIKIFLLLTLLTGVAYPLVITLAGRLFFPAKAEGSLVSIGGKIIGSKLIAQKFTSDRYFWQRPSAVDYNPLASGASNLGPTSEALRKSVTDRAEAIRKASGGATAPDALLFASASGLDPELSPEATRFQIDRVAKARGFTSEQSQKLHELVDRNVEGPDLGFIGEPRVNVLVLNLALDQMANVH